MKEFFLVSKRSPGFRSGDMFWYHFVVPGTTGYLKNGINLKRNKIKRPKNKHI